MLEAAPRAFTCRDLGPNSVILTVTDVSGITDTCLATVTVTDPTGACEPIVPGEIVSVSEGAFEMGDPWDEGADNERPVHSVSLSAYEIGKYEVTNQEYVDVLNWAIDQGHLSVRRYEEVRAYGKRLVDIWDADSTIAYSEGRLVVANGGFLLADHPVLLVSWYGAAAYCNWLSEIEGLTPVYDTSMGTWRADFANNGYHLPTEAQWERAAAWSTSGGHFRFGNGTDNIGRENANYSYWYSLDNPLTRTHTSPVGYYREASPAGCYEMSGNVWEWCNDWWHREYTPEAIANPTGPTSGSKRVTRGGSWWNNANPCRSAFRGYRDPSDVYTDTGFRVAR